PEELNRQVATTLAEWHFAPTDWARSNLLHERIPVEKIEVTGNPIIDALQWTVEKLDARNSTMVFPSLDGGRRLLLATPHRRESFGPPFVELCSGLRDIVERIPDVEVVYPVHPNPEVRAPAQRLLGRQARIHLLPPLDYWQLVDLLRRCYLVITDSGGLQEEAPSLGKPVLVMRETTERPEGVSAGTARVVGTSRSRIVRETVRLLRDPARYARMAEAHNPYGDGRAGDRIAAHIWRALCWRPASHRPRTIASSRGARASAQ